MLGFLEGCSALPLPVCVLCDKCCNLGQGFQMNSTRVAPRVDCERVGGVFDLSDLLKNLYEVHQLRNQSVTAPIATISRAQRNQNQIRNQTDSDFESFNSRLFSVRFDSETVSLECRNFINCCKLLLSLVSCQSNESGTAKWN